MSFSKLDASQDASHPRSGILTPSSDGSLNQNHGASPRNTNAKATAESNPMEPLLKPTIVVKPHPSKILAKPSTLQPLMLLPRRELCLSILDLAMPNGDLPPSRLYESHVKILDLEDRMVEERSILIVRNEATRAVYAVEKAETNLYTICKLGAWVDILALSAKATVSTKHLQQVRPRSHGDFAAPLTTPHLHKENKQKRLAIEAFQSVVRKRGRSQSVSAQEAAARAEKRQRSDDNSSRPATPLNQATTTQNPGHNAASGIWQRNDASEIDSQVMPAPMESAETGLALKTSTEEIFNNIRGQYNEVLYKSKSSLAYFAKGPLSRARAAFHLDCDATLNMGDLIDFLKGLVLSTVQIDKKYRETIPAIVAQMKTLVETSGEENKPKKKRVKKMKLGKDGLYPSEEKTIRKWWTANKVESSDDDGAISPAQVKSHVDLLRTRETQLQMILILEILALEPLKSQDDGTESQLPGLDGLDSNKPSVTPASAKKRNKHNFPVLVDVHADRLCIWQSTASDELRLLEDSQILNDGRHGQPAQKGSADPLKDFCTDIIVPFFAARLPELCDSINRKLGGPVIIQPEKPERSKRPVKAEPKPKPGTATKRPGPLVKTSKTIERALYKEQSRRSVSRGLSNTIALMRSATSAVIPGLKREHSESILGAMAQAERGVTRDRAGSLSRSTSSLTPSDETKAHKQAMVEAELKNAISAIRKPNRELAGKSIVEAAERRTSGGLSHIRKSKKPTRHPQFQAVQVKATPANNRFRDALATDSDDFDMPVSALALPSSSASMIPSTGLRRSTRDFLGTTPLSKIEATPSKPSAPAEQDRTEVASLPLSSPLMARKPSRPHNVVPCSPRVVRPPSSERHVGVFETPTKAASSFALLEDEIIATPVANTATPVGRKVSIYEQLGWDNDFDDL